MIATERNSVLAIELEKAAVATQCFTSGVAATFEDANHGLAVGDVFGTNVYGFRTVTAVDGAAVTVDSAFITNMPTNTDVESQEYGVDPTIAAADRIEFVSVDFKSDRPEIVNPEIDNTFDEKTGSQGQENLTGDIGIALHGKGTAGQAPDADVLWQCAIGERSQHVAVATHGSIACTTTVLTLVSNDGADLKIGNHLLVDISATGDGSAYEGTMVTAISGDEVTVSPALTSAPTINVAITAGIHYRPTLTELHSFWAQYWRGNITKETYKGNKVSGVQIDFTAGQPVLPKFTTQGKETADAVSEACSLAANTADTGTMHIARYMAVKVTRNSVSTLYPVSNVSLNVANELYPRTDVTKGGLHSLVRTKRTITGSFSLLYENKDVEDAFKAGYEYELFILTSSGAAQPVPGNVYCFTLPKIKYTAAPKSIDSGLHKYDVTFKAYKGGTTLTKEDSIFVSAL